MRSVFLTCATLLGVGGVLLLGLGTTTLQSHSTPTVRVVPPVGKVNQNSRINPSSRPQTAAVVPGNQRQPSVPTIHVLSEPKVHLHDAERDAIVQVQMALESYLSNLDPPIKWKPSESFIRHRLIRERFNVLEKEIKDPDTRELASKLVNRESLQQVEITLEITSQVRNELLRAARQDRSESRLLGLLPILASVVLVLMAGSAYINLDERTKGYYTGLLRLAAAGAVLAATVLALWIFFRSHHSLEPAVLDPLPSSPASLQTDMR